MGNQQLHADAGLESPPCRGSLILSHLAVFALLTCLVQILETEPQALENDAGASVHDEADDVSP